MSSSATHFSPKATRTTFPTATHTTTVHAKSIRSTATIDTIESSPSPSSQNAHKSTATRPSTTHEAETTSSTRKTTSPCATTTNHRDGGGKDGDGDKGNSSKTTPSPAATTTKTTASHHDKHGGGEHSSTRLSKLPPIAMSSPTAPSLLASLGTSIPPSSPNPDPSEPAPTPQPLESGGDLNYESSTVIPSGHGKGKDNNLGISEGKQTTITTVVSATPTTETITMRTKMGSSSVETLEITTSFGGHTLTMKENPTSNSSSGSDGGDRLDLSGKNHLGAIFGGIVAAVIVSAVVFWLCMILRRRSRQKQERDLTNTTFGQGIAHLDIGGPRSRPMSSLSAMVLQFPPSTLHRKPVRQLVDVVIPDASPFKDPGYSGGDIDTIPDSYLIPPSRDNSFEDPAYSDRDDSSPSTRSVHTAHALSVVEEQSEPDSRTSSINSIPLVC